MIRANGNLVITDFGLSHFGKAGTMNPSAAKSLVGTPLYIAPEILFSKSHDRMVDYWSLVSLIAICPVPALPPPPRIGWRERIL